MKYLPSVLAALPTHLLLLLALNKWVDFSPLNSVFEFILSWVIAFFILWFYQWGIEKWRAEANKIGGV